MEIQEPSPRMLISAFRFQTVSPLLLDRRGELVARFATDYDLPEWNASQDTVQLVTQDGRRLFQLSVRDMYVSIENFEDLGEATDWARGLMSDAIEALALERVAWTGVRMHWLSAVDSFNELRRWFVDRFGDAPHAASKALGRESSDLGIVLEFRDEKPLYSMRFGPMRAEQAISQLFRDKDASHYPDEFLFLDIDSVYPDDALNGAEALGKWQERVDNLSSLGDRVARAIAES